MAASNRGSVISASVGYLDTQYVFGFDQINTPWGTSSLSIWISTIIGVSFIFDLYIMFYID